MGKAAVNTVETYPVLLDLYQQVFRKDIICCEQLTAHGSDREIIRLQDNTGNSAIGIFNENISENKAFIEFDRHFRKSGMKVPEIFSVSSDERFYLMEDLGDTTLLKQIKRDPDNPFGKEAEQHYRDVLNILPEFQFRASKGIDYSLCYQFDEFGNENIEYDVNYFRERFLRNYYRDRIDDSLLDSELQYLKQKLLHYPRKYFLYRDYQSRNIMLKNNELYFIDFQSGRKGFVLYDLASLLYDAKADVPQNVREELATYYIDIVKGSVGYSADELTNAFWYFAVIRILQAMGAYGYLGIYKGKKRFLESVPYALKNMNFILNNRIDNSEFKYLRKIFGELINEKT